MKIPILSLACLAGLVLVSQVEAADFTISGSSTAAQALGSGQTGTVNAGASLTVSGSTVAVAISGNNATLTNLGTIIQTGTGRAVRDNTGVTGLTINNGSATNPFALMQTADADVIQMNVANGSATLNNYGTMTSLNSPTVGGNQAVDFSAITTGANTINNYSTGTMRAAEADAVRPGVNGIVYNAGTMKSTTTVGASSDGVDAQNNTGVQVTNDTSGFIEGGRHGITGGALNNTVTFTTSVTNNAGGIIQGDNGSGVNLDGFNANQTATIINHGTITGNGHDIGNGVSHDGDGIDVDGLVTVTNTGTIRSINSFNIAADGVAHSEGITVGGGTITNSGMIEGLVAPGNNNAIGIGISLLGNDITTGALAGTREAIYGNATVTNQGGGLIRGDSGSGILVDGPASGFTVTINNNAGATIRGGATLAGLGGASAAIQTGADNDTVTNGGVIDGSSNGKAIDLGAGNNTLNVTGGTITGDISGGVGGTNTLNFNLGAGNTFTYSGAISNFNSVKALTGKTFLTGDSTYAGTTEVGDGSSAARLEQNGSLTGGGAITVKNAATFAGTGTVSIDGAILTVDSGGSLAPGTETTRGRLTLALGGVVVDGTLRFILDGTSAGLAGGYDQFVLGAASTGGFTLDGTSALSITLGFTPANGTVFTLVDIANPATTVSGSFAGLDEGATFMVEGTEFRISYAGGTGNDVTITVVPEPATQTLLFGGLAFVTLILLCRRQRIS